MGSRKKERERFRGKKRREVAGIVTHASAEKVLSNAQHLIYSVRLIVGFDGVDIK